MRIFLDRESKRPLYQQVREALERLIADGTLAPGDELPASRVLAAKLAVNRGTVTTAYDELVAAGLLHRHVGQGTFVAAREQLQASLPARPPKAPERRRRWDDAFAYDPLKDRDPLMPELARWAAKPGTLSFAGGQPEPATFPLEPFRRALNRVMKRDGRTLLQYGTTGGYPPFVELLRRFLVEKGIVATPEEILIVNGSQQGLDLVARVFVGPGDPVVVEDPTYHGALNALRALRARILPVPVDQDGLDVSALERLLERERPKLLYTMPTFQNPTGATLSLARRRRLVALAAAHGLPILEDDFKGDLRYAGEELPALRGLPGGEDVIYAGTFSKMLFPGMRLGWIVAPVPVIARLAAAKASADLSTSFLFQAAMVEFAKGTTLEKHARAVRLEYLRRRDALVRALSKEMPEGVTWTVPEGGFSLALRLPAALDSAELLPRAAAHGVVFTPGRVFSATGEGRVIRLSFGGMKTHQIPEATKRLAAAIQEELGLARRVSLAAVESPV
jgi:GntR family transcriptional regulator/MocR family aminotransferase